MRSRISIRGCVRPFVGAFAHQSVTHELNNFIVLILPRQILCTGSNPYNEDVTKHVNHSITLNVKHTPKWNGTEGSKVGQSLNHTQRQAYA